MSEERWLTAEAALRVMAEGTEPASFQCNNVARAALEHVADLSAQLAEARAEVERTNHVMRLERMARQDSEDRLKAQLTAAEAAREAVLASLAAAEAVAGEALKWAYRQLAHDHHYGFPLDPDKPDGVAFVARGLASLPTPSAALQRVREQAQREGAEQFLAALDAEMDARAEVVDVDLGDAFGAGYDQAHADFHGAGPQIMARLFPTPDAGGPT